MQKQGIEKIFEYAFKGEDFPAEPMPVDGTISHAIERIWPYVAQEAGYYSAHILNPYSIAAQYIGYRDSLNRVVK